MLTNNQHNQFVVTRKRGVNLTSSQQSFFYLFKCWVGWWGVKFCLSLLLQSVPLLLFLSLSLYLCLSFFLSLSFSVTIPLSPQIYDLGYSVSQQSTGTRGRKKKKKKQKVVSMKDIIVEVCNLLLLCKLPTRCAQTQSSAVALTSAQQGCDHDT